MAEELDYKYHYIMSFHQVIRQSYLKVHSNSVSEYVEKTRKMYLSTNKEKLSPGFNQCHRFVFNGKSWLFSED